MENNPQGTADVKCPQCGSTMVRESATDPKTVREAHVQRGMNAHASARFIDQMFQKTEQLGPIYRCPYDGYMMRVKGDGAKQAA